MSWMSRLKRADDITMPSFPALLTTTALPATAAPLMPAMNVAVCVPWAPMRMVFESAAPTLPISMLLPPTVTF